MAYSRERAIGSSKNPFEDVEDVDDFEFLSHPHQGSSGYMLKNDYPPLENLVRPNHELEQRRMQLLDERKRIEERTLLSSNASLGLVHESEQVGIQTAEELMRQREQLQNVEYKVDEVNSSLRTSQKHLNVMKSIFGGIKSYFGRNEPPENASKLPKINNFNEDRVPSKLSTILDDNSESQMASSQSGFNHPALRLRGVDTSGFREDPDEDTRYSFAKTSNPTSPVSDYETSYRNYSAMVDQRLDNNLDDLSIGLGRLKNLAIGLGDEIVEQNETLERLTGKVERADVTLRHQNRQINKILK